MATRRDVEGKLRELIRRLAGAEQLHGTMAQGLPDGKVLSVTLTDLDAQYWTVMRDGQMRGLHRGPPERADIRMRTTSDHLVDLVDGRASMLSSFMSGKVKVEASVMDLMRLRRLG